MVRILAATCALATAFASVASSPVYFIYSFNPADAAGVSGSIQVKYPSEDATSATIKASLDFSQVDQSQLKAFDGNCTEAVTSWKWHIHTKWSSTKSSDSFNQCSKAATDNHYDPLHACSPASEYIDEPSCKAKSLTYACTPAAYLSNPLVCEKGDLSGKFGTFNPDSYSKVSGEWTDYHYPLVSENSPTWSIVLHAVCGKEAPRIACAVGVEALESSKGEHYHPNC